jgi:hypothetical protein
MNKMIQLTENSWMIKAGTDKSGLLFKILDKFLFLGFKSRLEFDTLEDVTKVFGRLEQSSAVAEETLESINGYPLKHVGVTLISQSPPLYTKGTNLVFCAGYWAIKMNKAWVLGFCPKHKTTTENESIGPFKNRLEALNQVGMLNTRKNVENRKP